MESAENINKSEIKLHNKNFKTKKISDLGPEELAELTFKMTYTPLALMAQHPIKTTQLTRIISCIGYCIFIVILTTLSTIYAIVTVIDINDLTQLIAAFGLYTLGILKIFPLLIYNKTIIRLVKNKEQFWNASVGSELEKQVIDIYRGSYYAAKLFNSLVAFTWLLFNLKPFFDEGSMPVLCWYPPGYYKPLLFIQCLASTMLCLLVVGFNGLFLITVTDLRTQFRILNWSIQHHVNDGSSKDFSMLKKCVKQHLFLTKNVKAVEKIFMLQILSLYILTIISCCMELYAFVETPMIFSDRCRVIFYLSSLILQLGMFCFPAGDLTNEMFMLSESFYLCNWEDGSRQLQTWLPFVLNFTQQVFDFKAMGLITINKMAMVDVLKSTVSFLTLMRDMK